MIIWMGDPEIERRAKLPVVSATTAGLALEIELLCHTSFNWVTSSVRLSAFALVLAPDALSFLCSVPAASVP